LDCFLGAGNKGNLKEEFLVDETTRDGFVLFWGAMAVPEIKAFSCFQE